MTKHRRIFEELRDQIESGKYAKSGRVPSEVALAKRFGVSRPTAARALRDLQALGLLSRKVGSGSYLRAADESADSGPALTIGLFAPGLGNTEILDPVCAEITRAAHAIGASLIWPEVFSSVSTAAEAESLCRRFIARKPSGVIFAPIEHMADREAINLRIVGMLRDAGIAVTLVDRDVVEFPRRSDFDLISIDNFQAAYALAEHLIALGRKRFRFVARPAFPSTTDLRMAGCRDAIARSGISLGEAWTHFGDPSNEAFVKSVLDHRPDAIVCANDLTAALLIQTLSQVGVRLPKDISVVGFDDVKYATLLSVPLTTIRQPCAAIAELAVETLRNRVQNPNAPVRQVLLSGELIVRRSCGIPG